MKTFHYPLGHEACSTVTVSELRAELANYPKDMPILAAWEGIYTAIKKENFSIKTGHMDYIGQCLIIDVEN